MLSLGKELSPVIESELVVMRIGEAESFFSFPFFFLGWGRASTVSQLSLKWYVSEWHILIHSLLMWLGVPHYMAASDK